MMMIRCLGVLLFFILIIVLPLGILALLFWWLNMRDKQAETQEPSTAIEIPAAPESDTPLEAEAEAEPTADMAPPSDEVPSEQPPAVSFSAPMETEEEDVAEVSPEVPEETAETDTVAEEAESVEKADTSLGEVQPPTQQAAAPPLEPEAEVPAPEETEPEGDTDEAAESIVPPKPDNLKRIEGIGPKVSSLLQDAGILTFGQLADADMDHLREILDAANLRFLDPSTWPEQAKLAAAEDWEGLDKLQDELKGGRRA